MSLIGGTERTLYLEGEVVRLQLENEQLREVIAGFKELLDLDEENRPGTDLYDLMMRAAEIGAQPQSAEHAAEPHK